MNEPSKKLSTKQYEMLIFIVHFVFENQYQPDFREVARHCDVSLNAIHKRFQTLCKHQWVKLEPNKSRCITINKIVFGLADGILKKEDWIVQE